MKCRLTALVLIFLLMVTPLMSHQASALDLEGESSNVTVRACIKIHDDGIISLNFKVLWGTSEFTGSDIFTPKTYPPNLPWEEIHWNNLKNYLTPIDTIEHLFNSSLPNGNNLTRSPEFFVKTVLDIDVSFKIESNSSRVIDEFKTVEIKMDIMPSKNSYTIAPLKFIKDIDFQGFPPIVEVEIETSSSISIQASSFALNHFLYPEGHRFKSEALYFEHSSVTYDTSEDSIKVRKLQPFFSASILYSLWLGAGILSMIMVMVTARRAKKKVDSGFWMWIGIGVICFLAFLPLHLFLSYFLILVGFAYSVRKSQMLMPERSDKDSPDSAVAGNKSDIENPNPTGKKSEDPKDAKMKAKEKKEKEKELETLRKELRKDGVDISDDELAILHAYEKNIDDGENTSTPGSLPSQSPLTPITTNKTPQPIQQGSTPTPQPIGEPLNPVQQPIGEPVNPMPQPTGQPLQPIQPPIGQPPTPMPQPIGQPPAPIQQPIGQPLEPVPQPISKPVQPIPQPIGEPPFSPDPPKPISQEPQGNDDGSDNGN